MHVQESTEQISLLLFQEFYLLIYSALRVRLSFVSDVQHGKPTDVRTESDLMLQTRMCDFLSFI